MDKDENVYAPPFIGRDWGGGLVFLPFFKREQLGMLSTIHDRASSYTKIIDSKTQVLQTERLKTEPPQSPLSGGSLLK